MGGNQVVEHARPIGLDHYIDVFDGAAINMQMSNSSRKNTVISMWSCA